MCMSEEPNYEYKIDPSHFDRIKERVEKKRFKSIDYFIDQAIKVYLSWEENPANTTSVMGETAPTLEQYGFMVMVMEDMEWLSKTWKTYPEDFEKPHIIEKNGNRSWKDYLSDNQAISDKWLELERYHNIQDDDRASNRDFEKALSNLTNAQKHVEHITMPKEIPEEFFYDEWPMLFTHYSRILPVKIGLLALGELMLDQNGNTVNLKLFTRKAFDLCEEVARKQKKVETEHETSRENKISTGLPSPFDGKVSTIKQEEYEQRYKDRYFGKIKRNKKDSEYYFEGLMSALNLIRIMKVGKDSEITFTEQGRKLYKLENPILSGHSVSKSFSFEEKKFILEEIIPHRELELSLIKGALKIIAAKEEITKDITKVLDQEFLLKIESFCKTNENHKHIEKLKDLIKSTIEITREIDSINVMLEEENDPEKVKKLRLRAKKQTPIEAIRIGTMGRISELGLVRWDIVGSQSNFALGDKKLISIIEKIPDQ